MATAKAKALMPRPAVYLDECVDVKLAGALEQRGFSISTVRDAGMLNATERQSLLLTHNRRDFMRLHARYLQDGRLHAGIILIP